jgi:hypothetical protein
MNYAELQQAIREASAYHGDEGTSGYLLSDAQVNEVARLATGWAEARALERTRRLADEHRRHSLALEAHKARGDQQESRAVHAEKQLARFAVGVAEYEELAERAALAQRDADLVTELRRRIAALERANERLRRQQGGGEP